MDDRQAQNVDIGLTEFPVGPIQGQQILTIGQLTDNKPSHGGEIERKGSEQALNTFMLRVFTRCHREER